MKVWTLLFFTLFWQKGYGQTIHYTKNESYLFNLLARQIQTPSDTTAVTVLKVVKKDSLIFVQIVYSSLINFPFHNSKVIKDRENRLPEGYTRVVPVHLYFDAREGLQENGPAKQFLKVASNKINNLKGKYTVTKPLKLVSYGTVH